MPEFDEYKDIYHNEINDAISFSGKPQDYFTQVKAEYLIEIMSDKLDWQDPLKVLDVGCGHGDIHDNLTADPRKIQLTGIDVAASVIEHAEKTHSGNTYLTYDGHRLPFADNSFDVAFTICVMHHVPPTQWAEFLLEMRRVIRPGGITVVFEHNPLNPVTRRIVNTCPLDENAVLLKAGELRSYVKNAGLSDIEKRFILFTPFDGKLFKRFDRSLGWVPLGAQYYVSARKKIGQ